VSLLYLGRGAVAEGGAPRGRPWNPLCQRMKLRLRVRASQKLEEAALMPATVLSLCLQTMGGVNPLCVRVFACGEGGGGDSPPAAPPLRLISTVFHEPNHILSLCSSAKVVLKWLRSWRKLPLEPSSYLPKYSQEHVCTSEHMAFLTHLCDVRCPWKQMKQKYECISAILAPLCWQQAWGGRRSGV